MLRGATIGAFLLGTLLSSYAVGCMVESHHDSGGSAGGVATSTPPSGGSTTPMLVDVDPGRTLTANGGEGVGVFVEYTTGGHWHVWWTCDTNRTGMSCSFDVKVTVAQGSIANPTPEALETSDQMLTPSAQKIELMTTTTTAKDGVAFDATPGGVITVEASVDGTEDGSFFFFVQNGQVNGGFTGKLSDPLMFEGSSP